MGAGRDYTGLYNDLEGLGYLPLVRRESNGKDGNHDVGFRACAWGVGQVDILKAGPQTPVKGWL